MKDNDIYHLSSRDVIMTNDASYQENSKKVHYYCKTTLFYTGLIAICALSLFVTSDILILQPKIAIVFASSSEGQDDDDEDHEEENNTNNIESSLRASDDSEDSFLPYNNSEYGIRMNYPSDWSYQEVQAAPPDATIIPIVNMFPPISDDPNAVSFLEIGIEDLESPFSIDEYSRRTINAYRESRLNFDLVSSSADGTLSGLPAYEVVFSDSANGTDRKIMEVGGLDSENNRVYYLLFNTEESRYDSFTTALENIIDSFQLGSIDKGSATDSGISNDGVMLQDDSAINVSDLSPPSSSPSNILAEANTLFQEGNKLLDERRYEEAISVYDKVLAVVPNDINALNNKGLALKDLGRNEEANSVYDKVLALEPNDVDLLNNKGLALYNLGRYEEAITYYDKALAVDPNYTNALTNKASALKDLGRNEEAITYYDKALALEPSDVDALSNKGVGLYNLGRYAEAITYYDKALALEPNDVNTLNNKGLALDDLGRYEEALQYYDTVLVLDPEHFNTLFNKGLALYHLDRYDEAITYYDKALALEPNDVDTLNNKRLAIDAMSKQNTTSTTELSLNNKTDINSTTNILNTTDNNATATNFLTYQNSTFGITIQYPSDWIYVGHDTIIDPLSQPVVTFTPIEPSDSTLVRVAITPLPVVGEEQKPPLNQIANRIIELDQQTLLDFKLNESRPITLKDGTAAHMLSYTYTDPDFGLTDALDILMIKSNNLYAIEYFAEPQMYPIHLPKFQTMLDSLEARLLRSVSSIVDG